MSKERMNFASIRRGVACSTAIALVSSSAALHAQTRPEKAKDSTKLDSQDGRIASARRDDDAHVSPATAQDAEVSTDEGSSMRTIGFIAGGVGIVGFILFAVTGLGAKSAHDRLDQNCGTGQCRDPWAAESDIADGRMLQTAANIGLATGLTGVALGATLLVLDAKPMNDAPHGGVSIVPQGGVVTFGGRF
jgi:hypothetical protein